jgi:hypothetical protein
MVQTFLLLLQISVGVFWGGNTQYFVDSVTGNDSNNGLSPNTAKLTIGAIPTLKKGDIVNLAKGSYWREQLHVTVDSVTIQSYGSGVKPILDGADPVTAVSWTKTGGLTNVYQATVITSNVLAATGWVNTWANNVQMVRASSAANADTIANSYFPSSDSVNGPITLYVHLTSDVDPSTLADGWIEYTKREFGLDTQSSVTPRIVGIWTKRNLNLYGSLTVGRYGTATDCRASYGGKHNVYLREGVTATNLEADEAYFGTNQLYVVVFNTNVASGEPVTIINPSIHAATLIGNLSGGIYGHTNVSGSFGPVVITTPTVTNLFTGISAGSQSASVTVSGATITGGGIGIGSAGVPLTINGSTIEATLRGVDCSATTTVIIRNTSIAATGAVDGLVYSAANNIVVDIQDSVFPSVPNSWFNGIRLVGTGVNLTSLRNTMYVRDLGKYYYLATPAVFLSDYNTISNVNAGCIYAGGTYTTWNTCKAATGQDQHSTP